jgi:hypothetical protein
MNNMYLSHFVHGKRADVADVIRSIYAFSAPGRRRAMGMQGPFLR